MKLGGAEWKKNLEFGIQKFRFKWSWPDGPRAQNQNPRQHPSFL